MSKHASFVLFVLGCIFIFWIDSLAKVGAQDQVFNLEAIKEIAQPILDLAEPYKVASYSMERGVPI